jgi:DNA (cytosine-5)-methyltransferase 1
VTLLTRPRLLDLFCCAGGAARGYQLAGFHVTGVDVNDQPRYAGNNFIRSGVGAFLNAGGWRGFDAIHASPPCQGYTIMANRPAVKRLPKLIGPVRKRLEAIGLPWIIENVMGARPDMRGAVMLCGASFGLGAAGLDLPRHRLFESSIALLVPPCQHRRGKTLGVYGHGTNSWHREKLGRNITMAERREAMGIDWMRRGEDSEAIPPAYTEFLGKQLMKIVALRVIERAAQRVLREQAS